jgi:hypothetical protein
MTRVLILIFIISLDFFVTAQNKDINLLPDKNFPLWLKTEQTRTNQTSGIAFIKSECDKNYFLLADDIGFIHLLTLKSDTIFSIDSISFTNNYDKYLESFPKKDFEEIVYDESTDNVYLSIEGNGKDFNDHVGIYKLIFKDNDVLSKQVISIEKVNFKPADIFYKYTNWNTGYEGVALDNNYFYLGLEGFVNNYQFADSTVIFIANKSHLNIIKTISTKSLGIHTICGLFSDEDYSLWGIDRNSRTIFHIQFDTEFNIINFSKFEGTTLIPGYHILNYLPSYESITMDDEDNIYIVDDPWKEVFVPEEEILNKLDKETINNFKEYIPIIFKYKLTLP